MKPYRSRMPPPRTGLYAIILILLLPVVMLMQGKWISKNQNLLKKGLFLQMLIQKVECEHCGGVGLIPDKNRPDGSTVICPVCFGVGSHAVRKFDKRDVLCPLCGGSGRVIDERAGIVQDCPRCEGRGLIRLPEDETPKPAAESGRTQS